MFMILVFNHSLVSGTTYQQFVAALKKKKPSCFYLTRVNKLKCLKKTTF